MATGSSSLRDVVLSVMLAGLAACSSASATTTIPDVPDARLESACFSSVPPACTGMTYTVVDCSGLCSAATVYFLCDGTGFTSFECMQPSAPWSVWAPASVLDATPD